MKIISALILFFTIQTSFSQKILELNYHSLFRKEKSFQFFNNSKLDYKLRGDLLYRTHKLVNMNDSLLIFDDDSAVKLSQLKAIKIRGAKISRWFFTVGALFFILDSGNNIANGNATILNEQTALVTSICVLSGIIVKRLQDKHVYIRKNVIIRILDTDYQNLNK